ncbi:MAG: hypothetical protein COB14_00090 [Alphaproteobacteria bacterium]|nr:MAG: hypothetical protein COB14_00090 [Alphaproteobacteria bacterium]
MVVRIVLLVSVLLAIILLAVGYQAEKESGAGIQVGIMSEEDAKRTFGLAVSSDKQKFENHVRRLLFVSLDDINRGRTSRPIDMEEIRQFFTEKGWVSYMKYLTAHKKYLQEKKVVYEHTQVMARFLYDSQMYSENGAGYLFEVEGNFFYASYDAFDYHGDEFDLKLSVEGDFQEPSDMKIDNWQVTFRKKQ